MSATGTRIQVTFKGLLAKRLWEEFPGASIDEIEERACRLIRSCDAQEPREQAAWDRALNDRAKMRGFA